MIYKDIYIINQFDFDILAASCNGSKTGLKVAGGKFFGA